MKGGYGPLRNPGRAILDGYGAYPIPFLTRKALRQPAPGSSLRSAHRDEKWRDDPLSTFAVLKRKGEGY